MVNVVAQSCDKEGADLMFEEVILQRGQFGQRVRKVCDGESMAPVVILHSRAIPVCDAHDKLAHGLVGHPV